MSRPLCRYCGKPIRKYTSTVYFVATQEEADRRKGDFFRHIVGSPTTKAEAQKLINEAVISVSRGAHRDGKMDYTIIGSAGIWDGRYVDEYFCNGEHAKRFAYAALGAYPELGLPAYHTAVKTQINKEKVS